MKYTRHDCTLSEVMEIYLYKQDRKAWIYRTWHVDISAKMAPVFQLISQGYGVLSLT